MNPKLEHYKKRIISEKGKNILKDYSLIGEYVNARTPIEIRHERCGYEWETTPYSFTGMGTRCPNCNGGVTLTQEQFEGRILKRYGTEYNIVGTYINNRTPIKVNHIKCGMTWEPYPDNLLRGNGCPQCCYRSKGELFISKYLDSLGVHYEREYTFKDLFYKNERYPLRMDFYLEKENIVIEYDGIQYSQPVELFGGERAFEETQIKDELKNIYSEEKGINMVRIPYFYSKEEVVREIDKILVNK